MAAALRELAALTGPTPPLPETCIPLDKRVVGQQLGNMVAPTIITEIDSVAELLASAHLELEIERSLGRGSDSEAGRK